MIKIRLRYYIIGVFALFVGLYGVMNFVFDNDNSGTEINLATSVSAGATQVDDVFEIDTVSRRDGSLEVGLKSNVGPVEVLRDPVLVIGNVERLGKLARDGSLVIVFDDAPANLEGAAIEIPVIAFERGIVTSQPAASDSFSGPEGTKYFIDERVVDVGRAKYKIAYTPEDARSPYVARAAIRSGDTVVYATNLGAIMSFSTLEVDEGTISFPTEAAELVESGEAMLEITSFKWLSSQRLDLPSRS